jgi:cell division protein FtsB
MNIMRFRRYDLLVSIGCLALLCSFAWYAYKGPRGYAYRASLEQQISELATENAALAMTQSALEKRVRLLRPERVDRDMLEQLARTELELVPASALIVATQK